MAFIYLSHILSENTPSYGSKDHFSVVPNTEIRKGDTANTSSWTFTNNHLGTHIDLPFHFDDSGKQYEDYSADLFIFNKVGIIDISCNKGLLIVSETYPWEEIDADIEMLLIRTGFENKRNTDEYRKAYPGISAELCRFWKKRFKKLRCIGFDFISLTSPLFKAEGKAAHRELLNSEKGMEAVWIIEDMSLKMAEQKIECVIVAPLRVTNGNGGPVTVFAKV